MIPPRSWPPGESNAGGLTEGGSVSRYHYPEINQEVVIRDGDEGQVRLSRRQVAELLEWIRRNDIDKVGGWE